MGEIVSEVATTLVGKIASKAYQDIALAWSLRDDVEKLKDSMKFISGFLIDAEDKQFKDNGISEWLQQLKQAFYDASDVLDEIECEAKIREIVKMYGSVFEKVCRCFSGSNPLVFRVKMAHKIKDIKEKIDEIASYRTKFGLTEQHANDIAHHHKYSWRETHSSVPTRVTGRDEEKKKIISYLMSPTFQSQVKNIGVVPIVAMGGWGKTTLAQMAYNDEKVIDHYEMRMWVHASDDVFDVKGLTSKILRAGDTTKRGGDDNLSLDELQNQLHEKLYDKKFLLVLDDVWNENVTRWDELREILLGTIGGRNNNESKIIVTTRSHKVAFIMGTIPEINLGQLPEKECMELFVKCAFQDVKDAERLPRLKAIGKEIVAKCKGVPLVVLTLGCLLRSQQDETEWKKIRDSEIWKMDRQNDYILPGLRLSYSHLPSHLKQCFSYCAVFPKGHGHCAAALIPFWMAHGLLQPTNESEGSMESLGELYFKQLISASFFQVDDAFVGAAREELKLGQITGGIPYIMHDLIHDLAESTMPGQPAVITSDTTHVNEKVRFLSVSNNGDRVPSLAHKRNKVQAFGTWRNQGISRVTEPFVKWILKEFKYLRVLDLQHSEFELLPDCFGKMKHLRYLNLGGCDNLKKLPNSICDLYNLQILNLLDCEALEEFPKNMRKLVSLRILYITARVRDLNSLDIKCFKSLQILIIGACENLVILPHDLRHLTTLKKLLILGCGSLARFEDDGEEVGGKKNEVVKDLSLQTFVVSESPKLEALPDWLERSAKTLHHMGIEETNLTALPEWLPNLTSLKTLSIRGCKQLLSLPENMNRLTNLQNLNIIECPELAARCQRDKGPEWSKIAHIPHVHLDEFSSEPDESEDQEE